MDEDGSRRSRLLSGGEGTRSTVVTITSTVVFFGVIGYLIVHSAGWPAFKQSFFNAEEFRYSFPLILRRD